MSHQLRYGSDQTLEIEPPRETELTDCTATRGVPLDDPVAAVAAALCDPLDFPPLSKATVEGDRIVVALEPGVPQAAAVVAGVVHTLLEGQVQPHEITLLRSADIGTLTESDLTSMLPAEVAEAITLLTHDPCDRQALAYLAVSKEGKPIYLNRAICDADVVLPIGLLRLDTSPGYVGVHGGLFPTFSDNETRQRFHAPNALDHSSSDQSVPQRRRRDEADEAAWLLGVQFTLQVVPGPGDSILHILAGESHSVAARGQQLCQAAWLYRVPHRASLVVATIEGGPQQQTWENLARALFASSQAVADDGAIVLCTDLRCRPGPALKHLMSPHGSESALREIRRERSADAMSASLLAETCDRCRVYLLSSLEGEVVEEMGLAHVAQSEEIQRLSRQHRSCILLANAQHAVAAPEQE